MPTETRKTFERIFAALPKDAGLQPRSWLYQPHPRHFGTTRCAYCGERATTVDVLPNLLLRATGQTNLPQYVLVDACAHCRATLDRMATEASTKAPTTIERIRDPDAELLYLASNLRSYDKRRYFMGLFLRRLWKRHRGPFNGDDRLALKRRYLYALNRKAPPPRPLPMFPAFEPGEDVIAQVKARRAARKASGYK